MNKRLFLFATDLGLCLSGADRFLAKKQHRRHCEEWAGDCSPERNHRAHRKRHFKLYTSLRVAKDPRNREDFRTGAGKPVH